MPVIDPNSDQYDGGGILGAGDHVVFVNDIFPDVSKHKGTPFVEITYECHDPDSPHNGGTLRFQRYYITDKSTWRFVNVMRAARPDGCPPVDTDDADELVRELRDRALRITVEERKETYQGQTRTKREAVDVQPLSADDEKRLRAAYGGHLIPPMEGSTPPDDRKGEGGDGFSDDEIPF